MYSGGGMITRCISLLFDTCLINAWYKPIWCKIIQPLCMLLLDVSPATTNTIIPIHSMVHTFPVLAKSYMFWLMARWQSQETCIILIIASIDYSCNWVRSKFVVVQCQIVAWNNSMKWFVQEEMCVFLCSQLQQIGQGGNY